jgi:D-alanyl-lipoteichoic acid acyltransferase DltB (MBOAT superfamily)
LIVGDRALDSRLIHWPSWTIMSFGTLHHSIISTSKTWRAFSSNCKEDTRVTLCFEICFIGYADINDGIP